MDWFRSCWLLRPLRCSACTSFCAHFGSPLLHQAWFTNGRYIHLSWLLFDGFYLVLWGDSVCFGLWVNKLISYIIWSRPYWGVLILLLVQNKYSWSKFFINSGGWFFGDWWNGTYFDISRLPWFHILSISLLWLLNQPYLSKRIRLRTCYLWLSL